MAFRNPIVQRELAGTLRTRRAAAALVLLAGAFTALVVLRWPSDARVDLSGAQSREVFRLFAYGLLSALLLLVPIAPAVSIVREKQSGTLELLLNSPMTRWSIYWGKLLGCLGFVLLLIVMSWPAAAACYAMGGLTLTGDVFPLYAVLAIAALQATVLALTVSAYANSTDAALRITYGGMLLIVIVSLGPHLFFQGGASILAYYADWLRCLSPITPIMEIVGHGDVGAQGILTDTDVIVRFFWLAIATTGVCSVLTIARLDHTLFDRSRSQGIVTDDRTSSARLLRRLFFVVDPQRRKRTIGRLVNPVMVKEFRCRRFGRMHWMLRLAAASALISLLLTYATTMGTMDWGVDTIGGIMVLLQAALIVLIAPSLAAGLISSEVESGGWQLLQMTPLSSARILRGKLASVIWPVLLILVSTLPGYLVMVYIQPDLWLQIQYVLICLSLTSVLAICLSLAASTLFNRTAVAMTVSYAVLMLLCGGTMLIWLLRDAPFGFTIVRTSLVMNPIAAALQVIGTPGFAEYSLIPASWWFTGIASALCSLIVVLQTHRRMRPQ